MVKQLNDYKEGVFQTEEKPEKKDKEIRVHICPKCRSYEVHYVFGLKNAFGVIPTLECKKCKFKNRIFPQLVIKKSELDKANKKAEAKLNKKKGKK